MWYSFVSATTPSVETPGPVVHSFIFPPSFKCCGVSGARAEQVAHLHGGGPLGHGRAVRLQQRLDEHPDLEVTD